MEINIQQLNKSPLCEEMKDKDAASSFGNTHNLDRKDQECNKQIDQLKQIFWKIRLKQWVSRFAAKTKSRMLKKLKEYHFQLINDKSIYQSNQIQYSNMDQRSNDKTKIALLNQQNQKISLQQKYTESMNQSQLVISLIRGILNKIPTFYPSSFYKFVWDYILLIAITFLLFVIPIKISFNIDYDQFTNEKLVEAASFMIFTDIAISINTGYYDKGMLIKDRWQIIKNYIKTSILTEILGCISLIVNFFDFYNGNLINDIILIMFLFKINHFSKIACRLQERFLLNPKTKNVLLFIKLFLTILFISHIFACTWIYVAIWEKKQEMFSWVDKLNLSESEWHIQYCQSIYFIIVTMCTVGYGDTTPINFREQILCILTILTACGVFGYSMNTIGIVIQEFSKNEKEIDSNLYIISSYMHSKQINNELQYQVRKYLEYYYREISTRNLDAEEKIIGQLSEMLKKTLQIEANKIIIKDSPIFAPNFSDEILIKTIPLIQECRYTPDEIIYHDKQQDDSAIYFIEKGQVELFTIQNQGQPYQQYQPIKVLDKGKSFGSINFFTGLPRQFHVKSLQFSTLLKIKRDDFINLVKGYQEEYEVFCHIKDSILHNSNYFRIGETCYSCNSLSHTVDQCPFLHLILDRIRLSKISNRSTNQDRQTWERKQYQKQHKYDLLNYLFQKVDQFNDSNASFLDHYEEQYLYLEKRDVDQDLLEEISEIDLKENKIDFDKQQSTVSLMSMLQRSQQQQQKSVDSFTNFEQCQQQQQEMQNQLLPVQQQQQHTNLSTQDRDYKFTFTIQENSDHSNLPSQSSSSDDEDEIDKQNKIKKKSNQLQQQKSENLSEGKKTNNQQENLQILNMGNPGGNGKRRRQTILQSNIQPIDKKQLQKQISSDNKPIKLIQRYLSNLNKKLLTPQIQPNQLNQQQQTQPKSQENLNQFDKQFNYTKYMPWNNLENVLYLINIDVSQYKIELEKIIQEDKNLFDTRLRNITNTQKNNNNSNKQIDVSSNSSQIISKRKNAVKGKVKVKQRYHSNERQTVIQLTEYQKRGSNQPIKKSIFNNCDNISNKDQDVNSNYQFDQIDYINQENLQSLQKPATTQQQNEDFSIDNMPKNDDTFRNIIPVSMVNLQKINQTNKNSEKPQYTKNKYNIEDSNKMSDIEFQ